MVSWCGHVITAMRAAIIRLLLGCWRQFATPCRRGKDAERKMCLVIELFIYSPIRLFYDRVGYAALGVFDYLLIRLCVWLFGYSAILLFDYSTLGCSAIRLCGSATRLFGYLAIDLAMPFLGYSAICLFC